MTDQLQFILLLVCLGFILLILWAAGIAFTYWDSTRRNLSTGEVVAWIVLAALLPLIGAAAYLFSRFLGVVFSPGKQSSPQGGKRITLLKQPPQPAAHSGTVLAADLLHPPIVSAQRYAAQTALGAQPIARFAVPLFIKAMEGPHAGIAFTITNLPAHIGRVPEAEICLNQDLGVSRHHAEIYELGGKLHIRDLGSAHGTHLGGSRIEDQELAEGDRIQVGMTTLVVLTNETQK